MIRFYLIFVLLVTTIKNLSADSPVTSTSFYSAYQDIALIMKAAETRIMNFEFANFLSGSNRIDQKVALINALGWDIKGKNNKALYEMFLNQKYKTAEIKYELLTPDEHLCLGYLALMDDYNNLRNPITLLKAARKRKPQSYTFNIIYALALSQLSIESIKDDEWDLVDFTFIDSTSISSCNVYLICARIEANKGLLQDFRSSAKNELFSYLNIYKHWCSNEALILIPSTEHFDEVKDLKINLVKRAGVYWVPVKVNGIPMEFIFDTGASSVSISLTEAYYMFKNGKLSRKDVLGKEYFSDANGNISEGTVIILREVKIGNRTLTNVQASIVHNLKAPLLFGQSALEKLGKVVFDAKNQTLLFE